MSEPSLNPILYLAEPVSQQPHQMQPAAESEKSQSLPSSPSKSTLCDERDLKDLESAAERTKHVVVQAVEDPNLVGWDGDDDPANPMNWSQTEKWMTTGIASMIVFLVPLSSTMFAPGVRQVLEDFHVSNETLGSLVISIYVLGLALGPLILAPLSEVYGRLIIYSVTNVLYVIFTVACGVSTDLTMMIVWRFLAGCVGSAPLAIGAGTIADLFPLEQRGLALSLFSLGPIAGPAIGPVIGGFLTQAKGWRWIFWLMTVLSGATTAAQLMFMRETYAVTLLARKTEQLRKETGNLDLKSKLDTGIPPRQILIRAVIRPTRMTLFSPINILLSISSAFVYGILYLLLTTFPLVFEEKYGFSAGISGLTYIGLGVGNIIGLLAFSMTSDRYVTARRAAGKLKPEDRLPFLILSGPVLAMGLFWYGWAAQKRTHWIVPIIGSSFVGIGNMFFFMPVSGYLVDAFTVYAASAFAANTVLRSIGGALLPLAGTNMYASLGVGWGNSLLGFLTLAFCPALIGLYFFGEKIRLRYPVEF